MALRAERDMVVFFYGKHCQKDFSGTFDNDQTGDRIKNGKESELLQNRQQAK